jgi:hypothetical protein
MTVTDPRVQDSVGTALHYLRSNWRAIAVTSSVGALATTAVQMAGGLAPTLPLLTVAAVLFLSALIYAVFLGLALRGAPARFVWSDGVRLFAAMAVVGFFLVIVAFVLTMLGLVVLLAGPYASFVQEIERVGSDQAAVSQILLRMWMENPWPVLVLTLLYVAVWFYLTTRLYLAAPATLDRGRILTFETWSWTKHAAVKVMGARAMLVGPAFVLTFALTYLLARAAGLDLFNVNQAATAQPAAALAFAILSAFINFFVSDGVSAGLSTALYRDLGGKNAALPPR